MSRISINTVSFAFDFPGMDAALDEHHHLAEYAPPLPA